VELKPTHDVIVIGAGVIGLSLALELDRHGLKTLILERSHPGQEASYAAGGMLTAPDWNTLAPMRELAQASLALWPEFARHLEAATGEVIDYCDQGSLLFFEDDELSVAADFFHSAPLSSAELKRLEPAVAASSPAVRIPEASADPRGLLRALIKMVEQRGIRLMHNSPVTELTLAGSAVSGVRTDHSGYSAGMVVNCAGAWSSGVSPLPLPVKPIKGHMLSLLPAAGCILQHVIRAGNIYLVPRSDGRILVGSTVEDAGFDKHVDPETIQRLHHSAAALVPALSETPILESWTGLRPGSEDGLPIMGATRFTGHFVATGHFRDGILLAPITARLMAQAICGDPVPLLDIFSPMRFLKTRA